MHVPICTRREKLSGDAILSEILETLKATF